ncbi:hypothetical protein [Scopulibacillus daqui]|nr:hypothetical protein [Scopulibacillus daqui]
MAGETNSTLINENYEYFKCVFVKFDQALNNLQSFFLFYDHL